MSAGWPAELSRAGLTAIGALNSCDEEPIAYSGAIQPHGLLLGVDPETSRISVVSDNLALFTGISAAEALGAQLSTVIGVEPAAQVTNPLTSRQFQDVNPVALILPESPDRPWPAQFEMVAHWASDLIILELQPVWDAAADLSMVQGSMRRLLPPPPDTADVVELCDAAVQELRRLTGYDRVMAYRFDSDAHGEVVAEGRLPEQQPFLGLHYPAGDIPRQARLLYFKNRLRLIADVGYQPVPLRCRPAVIATAELDLGQAQLRSVSPVHLQYLRNMGVAATMTVSLVVEDRLWGMLACHHGSPKNLSYYLRLASESLGSMLALQLRAFETRQEHARLTDLGRHSAQVITAMAAGEQLARGAMTVPEALTGMVGADGAVLQMNGHRVTTGRVPEPAVVDRILDDLYRRATSGPLVTDELPALLRSDPPRGVAGARRAGEGPGSAPLDPGPDAAGALYLSLDHRGSDCVLWLRAARSATVRWAGELDREPDGEPDGRPARSAGERNRHLTPRASFAEWREIVTGRSRPWLRAEVAVAAEFADAMPELLLRRTQNRLVRLALHDSLTGLANRVLLLDRLAVLADAASEATVSALVFVDLDQFKSVNDTLGHSAGDTLLVDVARRLRSAVRPGDMVARLGGDEFVVVLAELQDADEALIVAQRILRSFQTAFPLTAQVTREVTASIGLAVTAGRFQPAELLRRSDNALYSAKRAGRNRIAVFDKGTSDLAATAARTERELSVALAERQLVVHYQPIVSATAPWTAASGPERWLGVEALVRWQHPERGLLEPDHFVPLAGQSHLIDRLGEYVLAETLRQLSAWPPSHLYAAVNVSAQELARPEYAASVLSRVRAAGLPADRLRLEVTETQMLGQPERAARTLADLDAGGVRTAIDDFGTGFASLSWVRSLPVRTLKVDRSFVFGLPGDTRDLALVTAAIRLAHELGMTVVAEGVETADQFSCLRELGCDRVQGFLVSPALPASEVDRLLRLPSRVGAAAPAA